MKARKLTGLLLVVCLLVSMMSIGFGGTASAEIIHSIDKVHLTFDGDAPYGIVGTTGGSSTTKYTEAIGKDGATTGVLSYSANGVGGGIRIGADGNQGSESTLTYSDGHDGNLFILRPNTTYRLRVDVKYLAGSYVKSTQSTLGWDLYRLSGIKSTGTKRVAMGVSEVAVTFNSDNSETQTINDEEKKVLKADSDWMSIDTVFTTDSLSDGCNQFAVRFPSDSGRYVRVYVDNIIIEVVKSNHTKVYDYTTGTGTDSTSVPTISQIASACGVSGTSNVVYGGTGSSHRASIDENGLHAVVCHSNNANQKWNSSNKAIVYDADNGGALKLNNTSNYTVTIDYDYEIVVEGSKTLLGIAANSAPGGSTVYCFEFSAAHTATATGLSLTFTITPEQLATAAAGDSDGVLYLYLAYRVSSGTNQTCNGIFTIRSVTVTEETSDLDEYSGIHTMDNSETDVVLGASDKGTTTTVTDPDTESGHGNVLKMTATGLARISIKDTLHLEYGKKYYISYDAKVPSGLTGNAIQPTMVIGPASISSIAGSANRVFLRTYNFDASMNGNIYEKNGIVGFEDGSMLAKNFTYKSDDQWHTYGFIIDTTKVRCGDGSGGDGTELIGHSSGSYYLGIGIGTGGTMYIDNVQVKSFDSADSCDVVAENAVGSAANSIRAAKTNGIADKDVTAGLRFRGTLSDEAVADAADIGFIIAPTKMANAYVAPEGTETKWYEIGSESGAKTVSCINTPYQEGTNTYQLILTGLNTRAGKTAYNTQYTAMMYVKDANGNYTYYNINTTSYNEVKTAYRIAGFDGWQKY